MIEMLHFSQDLEESLEYFFNSDTEGHQCRCVRSYKYKDWQHKPNTIAHKTPFECNLFRLFIYRHLLS